MRRWGIRKKVLVVTLVPTLLTTLMLGLFFTYSWVSNIEQLLRDRGDSLSRQLSAAAEYGMATANRSLLNSLSSSLLEEQDVRSLSFYNASHERLLHTGPRTARPLDKAALDPTGPSRRQLADSTVFLAPIFLRDLMLDSVLEFESGSSGLGPAEPIGWVAVEMSHLSTEKETYKAMLISLLLVLAGVGLNLLIAMRMSRSITHPVYELNMAVARLKEGKLDTRVHTRAGPEFEQLESGLNAMAEELSDAQAEMQQNIEQATEDLRETLETIEIQNIELDFARKEALEASRIKSEFLANMSHEIRTPLNGIIGFTELLLKSPLPKQQRDHLNTIRKSSEILLTIINDILDFSKIEAGKLILDRVPFQLRDIIEDVMVMLAPSAHSKNLDLVPLVYRDVPDNVVGDPLRVKQVITNLVNNAIKFTQTGEVVLRVSLEDQDSDANRVTLRLSITDSGVGLSRAQQQSLFNAFSQADASTARQYGGTGLGLVISKRLVEEMGGKIGLESELGHGSTFWFTLCSEITPGGEAPEPRDALKGERVIYLEHQKTTGLAVEHLLKEWGIGVDKASTPAELLERVEAAQRNQAGYGVAMVGITRHLLNSTLYRELLHNLEIDRDCRTLLLTPTLDTHDMTLSGFASGHITKPVCREALYDELLMLVHGINTAEAHEALTFQTDGGGLLAAPRILAVDDNEANLKLVLTLLRDCNVRAEGAASGFEALSKARQQAFDLVFMDLQMPGMDGIETTERLRNLDGQNREMPVIALTAHALADEQERLMQEGFSGYLAKPISNKQLMDTIRDYTGFDCAATVGHVPALPELRDTRRAARPSTREQQQPCVDVEESVRLAAGKTDLAEELFSMLLEQLQGDLRAIRSNWEKNDLAVMLEVVHKLHGATRYCGVPELRHVAEHLEAGLKRSVPDLEGRKNRLIAAIERLEIWGEQTDWHSLFREYGRALSDRNS
ncbi:response regulator [Marinobacter salicampi]|uniref:response regulator n=1 Tax=Marinobacter salicampi TaxID=435907 RepID=UPI00140C825A|nr:response regulator [Marinobacter salicampi]